MIALGVSLADTYVLAGRWVLFLFILQKYSERTYLFYFAMINKGESLF